MEWQIGAAGTSCHSVPRLLLRRAVDQIGLAKPSALSVGHGPERNGITRRLDSEECCAPTPSAIRLTSHRASAAWHPACSAAMCRRRRCGSGTCRASPATGRKSGRNAACRGANRCRRRCRIRCRALAGPGSMALRRLLRFRSADPAMAVWVRPAAIVSGCNRNGTRRTLPAACLHTRQTGTAATAKPRYGRSARALPPAR